MLCVVSADEIDMSSTSEVIWAVIDTKQVPRGIRDKNLQNQDSMKLESEPKGPRASRSAKVKVIILDKVVQLKTF